MPFLGGLDPLTGAGVVGGNVAALGAQQPDRLASLLASLGIRPGGLSDTVKALGAVQGISPPAAQIIAPPAAPRVDTTSQFRANPIVARLLLDMLGGQNQARLPSLAQLIQGR
jgi:hypothetical protein